MSFALLRSLGRYGKHIAVIGLSALLASQTHAATYTCADGPALAAKLADPTVVLGDTIVLNAGTTYSASSGFVLPVKSGTGYLTIQSSAMASLPPAGQRVFPANAANMPKIQATGSNARTIITAAGAHHIKLIGLEIIASTTPAAGPVSNVILFGSDSQTTIAEVPHNLILDRCIVRAANTTQTCTRGLYLNSASTDVINCYFYDFKNASTDAQGIGGSNGPGPYNILNNYVEATAEAVMFGGSKPTLPNNVPSDIVVRGNHFSKNINWVGSTWLIKNHFELKAGRRVTVDGNVMNRVWNGAGGQSGKAITFKCVKMDISGNRQGETWTATEDITVTNNLVYDCGIGVAFGGNKNTDGSVMNDWPKNVTVRNNLFYNIQSSSITNPNNGATASYGSGYFIQVIESPDNITFDHNTAFATVGIITVDGPAVPGFVYTNNMSNRGTYGIKGPSFGSGTATWTNWFGAPTVTTFQKNVLAIAGSSSPTSGYLPGLAGGWDLSPFNNGNLGYPTSWTGVLQNQASPGTDFAGYKVVGWNQPTNTSTYPYNNTGTDAKDIGCNIDQLNTAIAGCISGVWSSPPVTVTLKNGVNGYNGATSFYVSGSSPTSNMGPARAYMTANALAGTNGSMLRMFYKFDLSSIPAGATIDSATLRLKTEFVSSTSNNGISCYRMAPVGGAFTVNYATATRNTYNGTNSWTGGANAGGDVANSNNDFLDTPDSSIAIPAVGAMMQFNVTSSVQAWVSGTPNNGWTIFPAFGPGGSNIAVRTGTPQDTAGSADYPELEITYH